LGKAYSAAQNGEVGPLAARSHQSFATIESSNKKNKGRKRVIAGKKEVAWASGQRGTRPHNQGKKRDKNTHTTSGNRN